MAVPTLKYYFCLPHATHISFHDIVYSVFIRLIWLMFKCLK